ncbi:MAG: Rrf2 family transcriptional regulator [Saprospiraceae bacterium]|nr:Rrf2 family transcriptional regulator [Saprospiraceae bacterium]
MFSKACEYAIKAVLHIAFKSNDNERVGVKEIAKAINSPEAFTGKIMQQLSKNKIVKSIKGPAGGFWIGEEERLKLNIMDIVKVIDGDKLYTECGLGLENCNNEKPCPVHQEYSKIKEALIQMHTQTNIDELAKKLKDNATLK